ncbi:MarR family transcriptional regulator, partial [Streptomyces sp. NPDC005122]
MAGPTRDVEYEQMPLSRHALVRRRRIRGEGGLERGAYILLSQVRPSAVTGIRLPALTGLPAGPSGTQPATAVARQGRHHRLLDAPLPELG